MNQFEEKNYQIFNMFEKQWALVTAGDSKRFNACTIMWGSLGTLWSRPGKSNPVATVYLHPARYTYELMRNSEYFTISFFPDTYRKALGYMGSHSGRDGDKTAASGLTPVAMGDGVTYEEANLTFLCRKIYQHQFTKEDIDPAVQAYYKANPKVYPVTENGEWQPHWVFIGEILDVSDKR